MDGGDDNDDDDGDDDGLWMMMMMMTGDYMNKNKMLTLRRKHLKRRNGSYDKLPAQQALKNHCISVAWSLELLQGRGRTLLPVAGCIGLPGHLTNFRNRECPFSGWEKYNNIVDLKWIKEGVKQAFTILYEQLAFSRQTSCTRPMLAPALLNTSPMSSLHAMWLQECNSIFHALTGLAILTAMDWSYPQHTISVTWNHPGGGTTTNS